MKPSVSELLEDVVAYYNENLSERIDPIKSERHEGLVTFRLFQLDELTTTQIANVISSDKAVHILALAWVLQYSNERVSVIDNDVRPALSVNHKKYDLLNPKGTVHLSRLLGYEEGRLYRVMDLEEAFSFYLKHDFDAADFINAFALRHNCAPSKLEAVSL